MRPRIKRESLTPSSVKVFSTFASLEEQKELWKRRKFFRELDANKKTKGDPKFAYVRIFGKEMCLPIEEIQKCNFKYYTR